MNMQSIKDGSDPPTKDGDYGLRKGGATTGYLTGLEGGVVGAAASGPKRATASDNIDQIINEERNNNNYWPVRRNTVSKGTPVQYKGPLETQRDKVRGIPGNAFDANTNENLDVGGTGRGSLTKEGYTAVRRAKKGKTK